MLKSSIWLWFCWYLIIYLWITTCFLNKKLLNNNNRRSRWSGAHCHRGSLMAVSTSGGVACRLSYRRMVDILNTSSTSYVLYNIVVCCICYNRWTIWRSLPYDLFQVVCMWQSCWSYVVPSVVLSVRQKCLKFASHHFLLYVVYMCQKSLNFIHAFKCYHKKCKLASLLLGHPIYPVAGCTVPLLSSSIFKRDCQLFIARHNSLFIAQRSATCLQSVERQLLAVNLYAYS